MVLGLYVEYTSTDSALSNPNHPVNIHMDASGMVGRAGAAWPDRGVQIGASLPSTKIARMLLQEVTTPGERAAPSRLLTYVLFGLHG